ncbi:MAG: hypothetical protein HRU05_09060 [Oceanospirillaceae bacterium]|nr:hypothetical protein [Oceanospirillaceae bacterium]NRB42747.1 hypothetical protein [Pseudomonadales bacterium]
MVGIDGEIGYTALVTDSIEEKESHEIIIQTLPLKLPGLANMGKFLRQLRIK